MVMGVYVMEKARVMKQPNIDDKIKEILEVAGLPIHDDVPNTGTELGDYLVTAFKQAFADEGYIKQFRLSKDKSFERCPICGLKDDHTHDSDQFMTGRYWYDRFEKELYKDISSKRNILMDMIKAVLESPRKESSVELWKLHIDAALDRLDEGINLAAAKKASGL